MAGIKRNYANRLSIGFPEDDYNYLVNLSEKEGCSMGHLVRVFVNKFKEETNMTKEVLKEYKPKI